jgi:hypothetical protein
MDLASKWGPLLEPKLEPPTVRAHCAPSPFADRFWTRKRRLFWGRHFVAHDENVHSHWVMFLQGCSILCKQHFTHTGRIGLSRNICPPKMLSITLAFPNEYGDVSLQHQLSWLRHVCFALRISGLGAGCLVQASTDFSNCLTH